VHIASCAQIRLPKFWQSPADWSPSYMMSKSELSVAPPGPVSTIVPRQNPDSESSGVSR
jgi:hypothetical protein